MIKLGWEDITDIVDEWAEKTRPAAKLLQKVASENIISTIRTLFYYNPTNNKIGIYSPLAVEKEKKYLLNLTKKGTDKQYEVKFLEYEDLENPYGDWVKCAESPTIRTVGEHLNYFPGQFFGTIPNFPSPLAALLTSALVGTGLGYVSAKLLKKLLPDKVGDKLPRTGAILGGITAATPALLWIAANVAAGKSINDPSLLEGKYDESANIPLDIEKIKENKNLEDKIRELYKIKKYESSLVPQEIILNEENKNPKILILHDDGKDKDLNSITKSSFDNEGLISSSPFAVDMTATGEVLWKSNASPQLTSAVMNTLYAASKFPDPIAQNAPGKITFHQLGQLAQNAVGNYAKGYLAGVVLNQLVGTPLTPPQYGLGAVGLGVLESTIPKIFSP
jgi:hypothetical protein